MKVPTDVPVSYPSSGYYDYSCIPLEPRVDYRAVLLPTAYGFLMVSVGVATAAYLQSLPSFYVPFHCQIFSSPAQLLSMLPSLMELTL